MSVIVRQPQPGSFELSIQGKLEAEDYRKFTPTVESSIAEHGKADLLVHLPAELQFTPGAIWEDLKFTATHYNDIRRLAVISDDPSKSWLATIAKPFTRADVRFFPTTSIDKAREWLGNAGRQAQAL